MKFQRSIAFALLAVALPAAAVAQTKLLRFPDLHGERVVFTYAGDLWLAPAAGGTATRLTAHPGLELFAKFSPDGEWIAFTGQYDGDEQVYVVPAGGGEPRLLTYYPAAGPLPPRWGYDNQVYGWTPDGAAVLFRSMRDGWDLGDTQLFTVPVVGGMPTALPMPQSGAGDYSPDGDKVVYSPLVRDFRHWKRYQGGWAQELYIFDLATYDTVRVTDHPRADRDPMWVGDTIYFTSDRNGHNNLYAYDVPSGDLSEALTDHAPWDVRWPSADPSTGRIVYELDGELQIFDSAAAASTPISIRVPDDGVSRRPSRVSAAELIEDFGLSPKGERAVFAARGDIFSAPIEHGPTRNLTRSPGAHDRQPAWSPDGKTVAFVSDADGEEEIWLVAQDGGTPPRQLTDGNSGRFSDLAWSPDSKSIAFKDQGQRLFIAEVESGGQTEIADDPQAFGMSYEWSPRGGYLAYSLAQPNQLRSIYVWSKSDGRSRVVTGEMWNEYSPTWDPGGGYLFFVSDREFHPQIGSFEFNYVVDREGHLYALALREDVEHPFPPRSDEAGKEEPGKNGDKQQDDGNDGKKRGKKDGKTNAGDDGDDREEDDKPLVIDWNGLGRRIARVPVEADNYGGMLALEGHLVYFQGTAGYYGRDSGEQPALKIFDMKKREAKNLVTGLTGVAVSHDRKKLLVARQGKNYQLIDAKPGGGDNGRSVSTAGLQLDRVPREEWRQIFDEVWRRFRDFFYAENMHGYDWAALRERYRPLLEHVAHRSDLNYVISEMIAELNTSHTYIAGGDWDAPERPRAALLGARFALDADAGRYRLAHLFAGDNAEDAYRSPLTEIGVGAEVGDYVLRIDGHDLARDDNPFRLLRHAGGGPVELVLGKTPDPAAARTVLVNPIRDEDNLIYLQWIERNRRWVDDNSGGRVGYLHLPNMGSSGISEWIKWYYGQVRKEGLVIDVRNNGGGNVSQMIIERLVRPLLMVDFERNVDLPEPYPNVVFTGKLVCLLDEDTASDGDQFAYVFKAAGLGKLVGKRSWGGVVGIYGRGPLIDGGRVSVPEAGSGDINGQWVIEGHGVDPDIEVDNPPATVLTGRDPQLEKALEVVLAELDGSEVLPERPADPVKTE